MILPVRRSGRDIFRRGRGTGRRSFGAPVSLPRSPCCSGPSPSSPFQARALSCGPATNRGAALSFMRRFQAGCLQASEPVDGGRPSTRDLVASGTTACAEKESPPFARLPPGRTLTEARTCGGCVASKSYGCGASCCSRPRNVRSFMSEDFLVVADTGPLGWLRRLRALLRLARHPNGEGHAVMRARNRIVQEMLLETFV